MREAVGWQIEGEFITNITRSWLWDEKKPYAVVEELLLSCLVTDQLTPEERKEIAQQILEGRKKLVGINSFTLEDDGKKIRPLSQLCIIQDRESEELRSEMEQVVEDLEQKLQDKDEEIATAQRVGKLDKIRDAMGNSNMLFPMDIELRGITTEDMVAYCEEFGLMPAWVGWGGNRWIQFYKDDELCSPDYLREIGALKERKVAPRKKEERVVEYQPWGWLSPTGEFSKGDFGDHEQVAYDIMEAKGWEDEFDNWESRGVGLGRDFLTGVKGYVLLHNPTGMPYTIVSHEKPLTKAQKEFLYDYFMKEGDKARANSFFED